MQKCRHMCVQCFVFFNSFLISFILLFALHGDKGNEKVGQNRVLIILSFQ